MRVKFFSFLIGVSTAAVMAASAASAEPANLRFATVGVGSAWYNYGAGIAEMALAALPEGSTVDVLPIAGSYGNIKLIQSGEAEMGISFPMAALEACKGVGTFDAMQDKVRGMVGGLDIYYLAGFMRADSGVTSWQDVVDGKADLATAGVGGTGETGVRQILDAMGSSKEKVAEAGGSVKALKRTATAGAISDGQADGWAHVVTRGHPVATQLTTTTDMRVLPLSDEVRNTLAEKYGWIPAEMPAGLFKGQDQAVPTVKAASNILVSSDVPDDVVYTVVKTILDNAANLSKVHAALADFDSKSAADPALLGGCELHPGARKAYEEAGIL